MSVLNSWCERICLVSLFLGLSILLADYRFYFLPIHGLWLVLYVLFVLVSTIWFVCVDIQKLLQRNAPFDYDFESNKQYQKLLGVHRFISSKIGAKSIAVPILHVEAEPQTPALEQRSILNVDALPLKLEAADQNPDISIDDRINALVSDIEQKFISKWYNLISDDENFPAEAKILLEGILRRVLQVSVQLDSGKILCGAFVILLKHLKEYRRAVKRVGKGGGCVEAVYRYGHMGNKSSTGLAHFTHQLTANVLREFISWELWTSFPCRLLVSILSKRLTSYIIYYISQPGWLNYKMLCTAASSCEKTSLKLDEYQYISLSDVDLSEGAPVASEIIFKEVALDTPVSCTPKMSPKRETADSLKYEEPDMENILPESMIENALTKMIAQQTAPILQRAEKSATENDTGSSALDNVIQTPYKRSEPVKIHSAKSSTKRWDDHTELANLSLGQDLLALEALESSAIHSFSGRRLWGYSADPEADVDKQQISWESGDSWSKEKEVDDLKGVNGKRKDCRQSSPPSISSIPHCLRPATTSASAFVTNTIRPIALKRCFLAGNMTATTLHNMRELQQSTVNNVVRPVHHVTEKAIHKIGDLQDEAVGVVEGIFDFGMAGIRKGLRLTGLQESELQKPAKFLSAPDLASTDSPKAGPKLAKLSHVTSEDVKMVRPAEESCWINPLSKESPNGFENQMLLENSPNLIENEAPVADKPLVDITESIFFTDSPEYEETADLASTISKLRSLLQQKSSESSLNTPAVSPMPFEDKPCLTPVELPVVVDGVVRPPGTTGAQDGGMQRFARTVTGMFNTFKTALPGNLNDQSQAKEEQWLFVENESSDTDLPSLLNSLLVERRDYCTVDTAYEAMDSLDLLTESICSTKIQWDNHLFADELDDLDSSIPITKALLDVVCECLQDTRCALNQEPIAQALLLLTGVKSELKLKEFAEKLLRGINRLVGPLPKNTSDNVLALDLDSLESIIETALPYYIKEIFGHEDLRIALKFFISSLQSVKINQDITLQFFELICSQLIFTSGQISPTPSA